MSKTIIIISLLLVSLGCHETEAPVPDLQSEISLEIIKLVNAHRESQNLPPLTENEICSSVATEHSTNMASGITDFGHDGFDRRTEAISAALNIKRIGENVAFGQTSAEQVMDSWINSEGHRANIEGDFTHIGVGIAEDSDSRMYFTQIFVKL